jgi:hypothetical protein
MKKYLLFLLLYSAAKPGNAQAVRPIIYAHLSFPLKWIYDLPEAGLVAIGSDFEIQLWDAKSQAFYGSVNIFSPENTYVRIRHIEYLNDQRQLAVVGEQVTFGPDRTSTFKDWLFLYDLASLKLTAPPSANGMATLVKFKYGKKVILPEIREEAAVYQYYYHTATNSLYTIDREGNLNR